MTATPHRNRRSLLAHLKWCENIRRTIKAQVPSLNTLMRLRTYLWQLLLQSQKRQAHDGPSWTMTTMTPFLPLGPSGCSCTTNKTVDTFSIYSIQNRDFLVVWVGVLLLVPFLTALELCIWLCELADQKRARVFFRHSAPFSANEKVNLTAGKERKQYVFLPSFLSVCVN